MSDDALRTELRKLKRAIRDDPAIRDRYDTDGDGEISGPEWERAVTELRRQLAARPRDAAAATRATLDTLRTPPPVQAAPPTGPATSPAAPARDARHADPEPGPMSSFLEGDELVIKQRVELGEAIHGYEQRNSYTIHTAHGTEIGGADEDGGSMGEFIFRQLLGPGRPLSLSIVDSVKAIWLEGKRPYNLLGAIWPPTMEVTWPSGVLGTIRRLHPYLFWMRRYELKVAGGADLAIDGSIVRPWTFPVLRGRRRVATISKKWSGIGREVFTDADTFLVRFEDRLRPAERLLVVAACFVVDYDFFEKSPGRD